MSPTFTPSSVPATSTGAGGPFSPSTTPGSGTSGSGGVAANADSVLGISDPLCMCQYMITSGFATASTAWPAANRALLMPFSLPTAATVRRVLMFNGGTVSGNFDAGIYNEDGTQVITTGSTAQAGIAQTQVTNLTPTSLVAGSYFMVLCFDNTTATVNQWTPDQRILRALGMQQAAAAVPLGASLTLAAPAGANVPLMSIGFVTAT